MLESLSPSDDSSRTSDTVPASPFQAGATSEAMGFSEVFTVVASGGAQADAAHSSDLTSNYALRGLPAVTVYPDHGFSGGAVSVQSVTLLPFTRIRRCRICREGTSIFAVCGFERLLMISCCGSMTPLYGPLLSQLLGFRRQRRTTGCTTPPMGDEEEKTTTREAPARSFPHAACSTLVSWLFSSRVS